jgi:tetratricopeptide (TPR) repeat protein
LDGARRLNEEGIEMGERSAFLNAVVQGKTDLVFADIALGEFGRAEAALPALAEEAAKLKGWHEWLVGGRIAAAEAEILLGMGRFEQAANAAEESIARAASVGRLKYDVTSRIVLGSSLVNMHRAGDALPELQAALADAKRLGHPPTEWRAASALGGALFATGDDAGAEAAFGSARSLLRDFAEGLSEKRREVFLTSPQTKEVLKGRG